MLGPMLGLMARCWGLCLMPGLMLVCASRMIQEEKESTELRTEEIETRVMSGSMEALNLTQPHRRGPIPTSLTALSLASGSPAFSGRSTPKCASRSAAQDLDRMGVMTLVSLRTVEEQLCHRWAQPWGWQGSTSSHDVHTPHTSCHKHVLFWTHLSLEEHGLNKLTTAHPSPRPRALAYCSGPAVLCCSVSADLCEVLTSTFPF